ncbi:TlpA family protein disulfide reductase [Halopseudomonas salina]|uniref:Thioredoxin n=1 Tax=Halopseudomonas salina TaxID=1323744 RepID=A0ABQ1NWL8_9GAMM|nr:TlpA disulfide reductase family protein [Halopseudomonas salina]GGC86261.1 thioredoxin [Halopseudomonas salina]
MKHQIKAWVILTSLLALVACTQPQWIDHRGASVRAADLEGRWVVVNYWAEWCAPCREELPELNSLSRASDQVVVLGIHFDAYQGEELRALSEEMDIGFSVVGHDFAEAYGLALPQVLPTTYVINPQGTLSHTLQGPQTEQELMALLPTGGVEND